MDKSDLNNKLCVPPCNNKCSFCFLNYTDTLTANYIFSGIEQKVIGEIIKGINHKVKTYQKGDLVASSGDEYNNLHIILQGCVAGEMTDFDGKAIRIEQLKAPETVGSLFIFGHNNSLPVDVICLEDVRMLIIPKDELLKIFNKYPQILLNYLNIITDRAQILSKKIKLLGLNSIKGKIAHYLLEQVHNEGKDEIKIKHTQAELAEMFGVARPALARVIRELHNENIIIASGKNVKIIDKKSLSSFLK